jgi:hypothetical protein
MFERTFYATHPDAAGSGEARFRNFVYRALQ